MSGTPDQGKDLLRCAQRGPTPKIRPHPNGPVEPRSRAVTTPTLDGPPPTRQQRQRQAAAHTVPGTVEAHAMPLRPCLDCGRTTTGTRCPTCTAQRAPAARVAERARTQAKRAKRPYTAAERDRRAAAVAAWRQQRGDWCPGWGTPPHPAVDLTADHHHAVGAGGAEGGLLTVLCRRCNGRKGAHPPG